MEVLEYRWLAHITGLLIPSSTLLLYYTVCYKLQEDPKLLLTGRLPESGSTLVALAPDSKVVTVAMNSSLFFFSTSSGEMMEKLTDIHGGE